MNRFVVKILRHKTIRAMWQFSLYILTIPLHYIGFLIPKKNSVWILANSFGFKDNARYLYEYILEGHPEICPVWISTSKKSSPRMKGLAFFRFSPKGIWLQYRAGIAFVSTGKNDVARFTLAGTKIIQLWHGIPIKHILLDSPETLPLKSKTSIINKVSLELLKKSLQSYSIVLSSSKIVQNRLASAFGLPEHKIKITGYPRHDLLFKRSEELKKWILYAPTWRSDIDEACTIIKSICNDTFVNEIKNSGGYKLVVSIHPLNMQLEEVVENLPDVTLVTPSQDIYSILAQCEILITDYSSIAIDFSMLNRKIIFYTPDINKYLKNRGIYEEFKTIIKNNGVENATQVLGKIRDPNTESCLNSEKYFMYKDQESRKRIVELAKEMLP